MKKYSNNEIIEDINNAKELKRILKDEKIKSLDFNEKYINKFNNNIRNLNIILTMELLIPLLTGNLFLSLLIFLPGIILKYRNEFKKDKFQYYSLVRNTVLNVSIDNLDNLVEDLNTVLESRKGKEIEESKINNLTINLGVDNRFYDDLLKLDKTFSPHDVIINNYVSEDYYMSSEEYYEMFLDKLFVDNTVNKEEYQKVKKIKCNYLFDAKEFKNI